jgi:hypothetical protein
MANVLGNRLLAGMFDCGPKEKSAPTEHILMVICVVA